MRTSRAFWNLWLQIALSGLHDCCHVLLPCAYIHAGLQCGAATMHSSLAAWMLHGARVGEKARARNLVFFHVKWMQAAIMGSSCVRHFTRKLHRVSCSGFLPSTSPMQHSRSTIRFAATSIHPCSHYNAICKHRFQNALELRTHDEPRIAKHHQGTNRTPKRTDRTRCAHEVPFIAGQRHLTRKLHKVLCSGFLPSTSPMQHSRSTIRFAATSTHPCRHYNAICKHRFQNALELRTHDELHCKTPSRNQSHTKTNGPHPPRTRGTFHRRLKPLYTLKNTRFRAPASLPKKTMQHECSRYNAFCSTTHTFMQP